MGDLKKKLSNLLKYSKPLYLIYSHVFNFLINLMKIVIKTDDRLVLFNSFGGKKFDDSPKAIYECILNDSRFDGYRLVWAFHNPDEFDVPNGEKIKTDNLRYFATALKARVWVTNSSFERGLHFKGKRTFYLNTWHGSPIKRMGADIDSSNASFKSRESTEIDAFNVQGDFEAEVFSRCFGVPEERILKVGLPRNDELVHFSEAGRNEIRRFLGISDSDTRKIILYCPTFREYVQDNMHDVILLPPMHIAKWKERLSSNYILLFRAHYEVSKTMRIVDDEFVRDMTAYPVLNDLMIVSDVLISDYSSIFFDYSIMEKCMLHFTYDFDEYSSKRGMYFDVRDFLSGSSDEDGLITLLKTLDYQHEVEKTRVFRNTFVNYYGNATEKTIDYVAGQLGLEGGWK